MIKFIIAAAIFYLVLLAVLALVPVFRPPRHEEQEIEKDIIYSNKENYIRLGIFLTGVGVLGILWILEKKLSEFNAFSDLREEYSAGWKFNEWEMKGIPIRLEIGPNDLKKKQVILVRRDTGKKEIVKDVQIAKKIPATLDDIQKNLFKKALRFLKENIVEAKNYNDFKKAIKDRKLVKAFFCGDIEQEKKIKEETGATSRCIPFNAKTGKCILTNKMGKETFFARAY